MSAIVWVVGGLVVLVAALLAVDWFTAGRTKRRILVRAKDQSTANAGVGYADIQNQAHSRDMQNGGGA